MLQINMPQWSHGACKHSLPESMPSRGGLVFKKIIIIIFGRPLLCTCQCLKSPIGESSCFMRSAAIPFNAELCFFCQEIRKDKVHEVSSFDAGKQLQKAVDESSNQKWKVQLSTATSTNDARARLM